MDFEYPDYICDIVVYLFLQLDVNLQLTNAHKSIENYLKTIVLDESVWLPSLNYAVIQ